MNDVRNLLPSFTGQRPSMNLQTPWYLYVLEDPLEIICYLDSKKYRKRLDQNGAESIPFGIPIFCLKTMLLTVKKHNIDKTLTYEVYFSISFRSPIDRSFIKASVFSNVRFECETDNF